MLTWTYVLTTLTHGTPSQMSTRTNGPWISVYPDILPKANVGASRFFTSLNIICAKVQNITEMCQVLLQTYIEYLRGKVEDNQTINHHGKQLEVEDGKVVGISALGGGKAEELTPVETIQK